MRDYREDYRNVHKFTCSHNGEFEDRHKCIFDLIEDMLKEIDHLRYWGPRIV